MQLIKHLKNHNNMKPFETELPFLDSITPTAHSCIFELDEYQMPVKVIAPNYEAIMDLTQDICMKIGVEIASYKRKGTYPHDDSLADIQNGLEILQAINEHLSQNS